MNQYDMIIQQYEDKASRLRQVIADAESRLSEISSLLALMKKHPPESDGPKQLSEATQKIEQRLSRSGSALTLKARLIEAVRDILSDGQPRFAREMLPVLAKRDIVFKGSEQQQATHLASYLSRETDLFHNNRKRGGYTLKQPSDKAKPDNAPTLPGLFSNGAVGGATQPQGKPRAGGYELG